MAKLTNDLQDLRVKKMLKLLKVLYWKLERINLKIE